MAAGESFSDTTVVISAAGRGTRLGRGKPKCLVEVDGRALIDHQFDILGSLDVIVVVGYQADDVIDHVRNVRPQTRFAANPDYLTTGTAASLVAGAAATDSPTIISLDGDLLVRREDFGRLLRATGPTIGLTPRASVTAVGARVEGRLVQELGFEVESQWEWSGLVSMGRADVLGLGRKHVFEGLLPHLPMAWIDVDCVEIDEPVDLARAQEWVVRQHRATSLDPDVIGQFWDRQAASGRTRWTDDEYLRYERQWLGRFVHDSTSILDLGSGFGELSRSICPPGGSLLAVDNIETYRSAFSSDSRFRYFVGDVQEFSTTEKFDLCLLFGVVTYLTQADEVGVYHNIATLMDQNSVAVVKNQCSDSQEFVVDARSDQLGHRYVGRYPSVVGQLERLRGVFSEVEVVEYPQEFRTHHDSAHVAFVCKDPR